MTDTPTLLISGLIVSESSDTDKRLLGRQAGLREGGCQCQNRIISDFGLSQTRSSHKLDYISQDCSNKYYCSSKMPVEQLRILIAYFISHHLYLFFNSHQTDQSSFKSIFLLPVSPPVIVTKLIQSDGSLKSVQMTQGHKITF